MTRNGAVGADRRPLFLMEQRAEAFGHPQVGSSRTVTRRPSAKTDPPSGEVTRNR